MAQKLDLKFLAVIAISTVALVASLYSLHTTKRLADDAFTPRLSFTDLQLAATYPDDLEAEETLLHYKVQNQSRLALHNLQIAEVVTTDSFKNIKHESQKTAPFDPGEPVDSVTYLTPMTVVPAGFTPDAVATGKMAFSIQFETQSSTDRTDHFTTCEKFHFNHFTGKFDRSPTCTPEVFK